MTHRRRRNTKNMRPYMVRHPKMVSVKFGKAKVKTVKVATDGGTDGDDPAHIDTPRPQLFSNQELVNLNVQKEHVYIEFYNLG